MCVVHIILDSNIKLLYTLISLWNGSIYYSTNNNLNIDSRNSMSLECVLPSSVPTSQPSFEPTTETLSPSPFKTNKPSLTAETLSPTKSPSALPSISGVVVYKGLSENPSFIPSAIPSVYTLLPTNIPTSIPSLIMSPFPTRSLTTKPSLHTSFQPSLHPTKPSLHTSFQPSLHPTTSSSSYPTILLFPSGSPSMIRRIIETVQPSRSLSLLPSIRKSHTPTDSIEQPISSPFISIKPSPYPSTYEQSSNPSFSWTYNPSVSPTITLSQPPSQTSSSTKILASIALVSAAIGATSAAGKFLFIPFHSYLD